MQVILKHDIAGLGRGGDVVKVADGYARNFLLPRGLVLRATEQNKTAVEHTRRVIQEHLRKERTDAEGLAERIRSTKVVLFMLVGENDRLFGSVGPRDLEDALREKGIPVDKQIFRLDEPIKTLGEFDVPVDLHTDVACSLKVIVQRKVTAAG